MAPGLQLVTGNPVSIKKNEEVWLFSLPPRFPLDKLTKLPRLDKSVSSVLVDGQVYNISVSTSSLGQVLSASQSEPHKFQLLKTPVVKTLKIWQAPDVPLVDFDKVRERKPKIEPVPDLKTRVFATGYETGLQSPSTSRKKHKTEKRAAPADEDKPRKRKKGKATD